MNNQKSSVSISKITLYGVLMALTTVATMMVSIPTIATKGYVNLGDAVVLLSGLLVGPAGGFVIGGIGSALADLFLGYGVYAPFTLVIKGLEGSIGILLYKKILKEKHLPIAVIIAGLFMATGYLLVESFMYGFSAAIISYPSNIIQGLVGAVICSVLYKPISKYFKYYN